MYQSKRLHDVYAGGVRLFLCGRPSTPEAVTDYVMQKKGNCMMAKVFDENGRLKELHYMG